MTRNAERSAGDDERMSNLRAVLVNRCTEDKWSAEARRCLTAATSATALGDCTSKHLTVEQRDKADRAASAFAKPDSGGSAKLRVTEVAPARGDSDGGTYVVIKGHGYIRQGPRAAKVYFGARQGSIVRFQSDSELIVQAPGGRVGETVDVLVLFDPGGQLVLKRVFTYVDKSDAGPSVNDLQTDAGRAVAKMERFMQLMCSCKDKACADKVNEDLTKWGTEMARSGAARKEEKPDPVLAKKAAEIMNKYTECMTKAMMAGAGGP